MKTKLLRSFFGLLLFVVAFGPTIAAAQNGTPHGVAVTLTVTPVGGAAGNGNTVAGYNIYRCAGTCTATGNFVKIDTSPDLTSAYLDPSTNLTAGSAYTYAATVVDNTGLESSLSPLSTVTVPSSGFPTNPAPPSGCNAKVQ